MAKILGVEAGLLLKNIGATNEDAAKFVNDRVTIELEEFKEEYTRVAKAAEGVNRYFIKGQYVNDQENK